MSTIRKTLSAVVFLVFSFCFVTMYNLVPAQADTCTDDSCVILAPPPVAPAAAPPTVRWYKHNYIRAWEPSAYRGGDTIVFAYGNSPRHLNHRIRLAAGYHKTLRVYWSTTYWSAWDADSGTRVGHGHVYNK